MQYHNFNITHMWIILYYGCLFQFHIGKYGNYGKILNIL